MVFTGKDMCQIFDDEMCISSILGDKVCIGSMRTYETAVFFFQKYVAIFIFNFQRQIYISFLSHRDSDTVLLECRVHSITQHYSVTPLGRNISNV